MQYLLLSMEAGTEVFLSGYRVVVAKADSSGNVSDPVPFAEGWLQNEKDVNGRPVDVQVLGDGSLLVSDDYKGVIYRINYTL